MDFVSFPKLARLSRECIISEKLDGTNGQIFITDDGEVIAGSRTRYLTEQTGDNAGFGWWVASNKNELLKLGPGRHFGEWWGCGIQRGYGLKEKRFSLFNIARWGNPETRPSCCDVVPLLYQGIFTTVAVETCLDILRVQGSQAVPGFKNPEGIVIWHVAAQMGFKKTLLKDEEHKGRPQA